MNNKPVAWIKKKEIGYMEVTKKCGAKDYATNLGLVPEDDDIPLYLHPVKELTMVLDGNRVYPTVKELTDEEIEELAMEYLENTGKGIVGVYDFVRAILKKANEK